MKAETFVVDAALLQELGERLIGRAPIALAELIKNAYDADSSTCSIEFSDDRIVISDDGDGMSEQAFLDHWMRLGTTHKVDQRISRGGRSLTGSKGVGRLSVQFLAAEMTLESTAEGTQGSLYAVVDWNKIVRGSDLDTVQVLWEKRPEVPHYPGEAKNGTRITLSKLKAVWGADELKGLGSEVWRLQSPFKRGSLPAKTRRPEDFLVAVDAPEIAGAREAFDSVRRAIFANWKARIRGTLDSGRSGGEAAVSIEFKKGYPEKGNDAITFHTRVALPARSDDRNSALLDKADFDIFVFQTKGKQPAGVSVAEIRKYLSDFGNVSVYDAAFRLPYYGSGRDASGHDWLAIALDQGRRLNQSELLPAHLRAQNKYMQDLPAPGRIFGGVNVDTNHERLVAEKAGAKPGEWLQIQSGRDRLHDSGAFLQLRDLVRYALDFYANRHRLRSLQSLEKRRDSEPSVAKYSRVVRILERSRKAIPKDVYREIRREVSDARKAGLLEEQTLDRRASLLAPLATAGMTALALSHELARETRFLESVSARLQRIARETKLPELGEIADLFTEAKSRLELLREMFAPLLSGSDTGATDRLRVRPVVERATRAMSVLMPGVAIDASGIPRDLRFPTGSLAEWNAILQNVLSNSWNAMLDSKLALIAFKGGKNSKGREWLRISDSGQGLDVPIDDADRLFEPFERSLVISEENRSIALGGQGLGLAIVRMIAHRRGTQVGFVEPEKGFATSMQLSWKGDKK